MQVKLSVKNIDLRLTNLEAAISSNNSTLVGESNFDCLETIIPVKSKESLEQLIEFHKDEEKRYIFVSILTLSEFFLSIDVCFRQITLQK